jgi:hypothetical protein
VGLEDVSHCEDYSFTQKRINKDLVKYPRFIDLLTVKDDNRYTHVVQWLIHVESLRAQETTARGV